MKVQHLLLNYLKRISRGLLRKSYIYDVEFIVKADKNGHFFEVLSKNGIPVTGAVIMENTLMIRAVEEYVVAFKADNTGNWIQHCHELHHAAAGMMQ